MEETGVLRNSAALSQGRSFHYLLDTSLVSSQVWSVTDFWGWDAQWARLRCLDEDGEMRGESEVPEGGP